SLCRRAEQSAKDALHLNFRGGQSDGSELRIGWTQLDFGAEAEETFEGGACAFDERDDDLSVTCFGAILYERDVAVADVLVNHRIARAASRSDALRSDTSQEKTREVYRVGHLDGV